MTVSNTKSSVSYSGNGIQTRFDFTFLIPVGTSVVTLVTRTSTGAYLSEVIAASRYAITGAGNNAGGYITMSVAPAVGQTITIQRVLPLTQETNLVTGAGFYPESVEDMVDESRMIDQQLAEGLSRTVRVPEGVGTNPADFFNTMMDGVAKAAGSATAAAASATSANTSKTAAANSATAAAKSESNASAAATKAATSESNAASSATSANVAKIEWKGAWNAATTYSARQAVSYQGSSWIAKATNKNVVPGDNASWEPLAMGGEGVAVATTTTSGVARQATEAEAVAGTVNGAVFVTPYTANRAVYLPSQITVTDALASGGHLTLAANATLTLDDGVSVGKYYYVRCTGKMTLSPGPASGVFIYGSVTVGTPSNGTPITTPSSGVVGILFRVTSGAWHFHTSFNFLDRLATDADALSMNDVSKIPTLRTGAITRYIGATPGVVLDIATVPVGVALELGGVDRVLQIAADGGDIPNGAEFRIHAYEGSVIRIPAGVNLYGRGSVGWNNTLIVGGGDWVARYKMAGVLRKASNTQWTLIANYQYEQATDSVAGVTAFATTAETTAGTLTTKAVTPAGIKAFAAPLPKTTAAVGQWRSVTAENVNYPPALPAGGTWAWYGLRSTNVGSQSAANTDIAVGVSAGGTVPAFSSIPTGTGYDYGILCWRIS